MGLKLVTDEKNVKVRVFDKTSAAGNNYKSYCLSVASKDKNNNQEAEAAEQTEDQVEDTQEEAKQEA